MPMANHGSQLFTTCGAHLPDVALRSGMSDSDVMLIAGWKTPVMLRRYLGSNEEGQRQALAAADKVFGAGSVSEYAVTRQVSAPACPPLELINATSGSTCRK